MLARPASTPREYRMAIGQLLAGATLISFSPVFVRLADVGPTASGFYRMSFGGTFLVAVAILRGDPLWRGWRPFALAAVCGVSFAADLSFWHRSILYIGPGLATIMGNFQVFFLAVFGIVVLRERIDWKFLVSVPLAFVGLVMLVGADWSQLGSDYRRGVLFGVATALTYATYVLVLQKSQALSRRLGPAANLAVISVVTAVVMGVEGRIQRESFAIPDMQSWLSLLGYGIICQAVGWIIISRGLARVEASRAGLILLLQPTLAFTWDVLFFSRSTGVSDAIGAIMALIGIYIGGARQREGRKNR